MPVTPPCRNSVQSTDDDGQSNTVEGKKSLTETRVSIEGAKISTNTAVALLFSFTIGVGERNEPLVIKSSACFYFGCNVVSKTHGDHAPSNHRTDPYNFKAAADGNNKRFRLRRELQGG